MNWLRVSSILLICSALYYLATGDGTAAIYFALASIQCALFHIAQILKRMHRF